MMERGNGLFLNFQRRRVLALLVLSCWGSVGAGQSASPASPAARPQNLDAPNAGNLHFVRAISSPQDFQQPLHPILDKTLDIVAGPADPRPHIESLQSPAAVVTDAAGRIIVADPGARSIHVFDPPHSRYGLLDAGGDRLGSPIALAVDANDDLYVIDENSRTILVYNSAGKFRRRLGELHGEESYFEQPTGLAINRANGWMYICDSRRNMVVVMDARGHLVSRLGKRGGGEQAGDFRAPTQAVVAGEELFVLDSGNRRVQIFDLAGHFRRAIKTVITDARAGLAVDNHFNVYVSDPTVKVIQVFAHDGHSLYTYDPTATTEGEFSRPTGMWVSAENCLYVVDSGNRRRLDVYQIAGQEGRQCP
jgi:DNA-binding beta-propeller fold protein YncE